MSEPLVIHALKAKRAELSGDLKAAEKRIEQLQAALQHVDATLRLFDPTIAPGNIKPRLKMAKPARFKRGEFSRAIMDALREAPEPLSVRDISKLVAAKLRIDTTGRAMETVKGRVRGMLARHSGKALVPERMPDSTVLWRVA